MTARDFLRWWGGQLAACRPGRPADDDQPPHRLPRLALLSPPGVMPATLELTRPVPGGAPHREVLSLGAAEADRLRAALGPPPSGWRRPAGLCLRLPAGQLLECEVALPLAAESSLEQVLGFEFDRLTPFRAADALWSHRVLRRDRARGRLHLRLTLASRAVLAPLLALLAEAGSAPLLLEAPACEGVAGEGMAGEADAPAWRRLALRPHGPAPGRAGLRAGAGLAAALALTAVALPFVRQSLTLAGLDARLAALRPAAGQAAALRRLLAATAAGDAALQAERARLGDPLQALAAITDALPDNTYVTDLGLRARRLTLSGQSAEAVRLIARLAAAPILHDPAFSAPVTRAGSGELFSLNAELRP